jgi:hypothetical protein
VDLTDYRALAETVGSVILGVRVDPSYSWSADDRWTIARDADFESAEGLHLMAHAHLLRSERVTRDQRRLVLRVLYLYRYLPGEHTGPAGAIDSESAAYAAGHALESALFAHLPFESADLSVERSTTDTHLVGRLDLTITLL